MKPPQLAPFDALLPLVSAISFCRSLHLLSFFFFLLFNHERVYKSLFNKHINVSILYLFRHIR